ncbi:holin [Clostridium chromiireducens]|uniref:Holin n=1 Tax=Clostridium chromiireducens TaxID=225345 RepID=A0A399IRA5_9CLOT|nr:phage holin family protein [Clostridium chromiireducens]RII33456.1 holin [Clostridium chromiireducens]
MDFAQYITENALILIPALYVLGMLIKGTESIKDKYIPIVLLIAGIAGAVGILGVSADSVIQGILVTGATVYTNQLLKQTAKSE